MSKQSEYNKKLYEARREQHLCLWCGKPLDRDGTICVACNDKGKKRSMNRRAYLLKRGICPVCGKRPVTESQGLEYKTCLPCRKRLAVQAKNKHARELQDSGKTYQSIYAKKKKEERRKNGLCYICGKNPSEPGYVSCASCRAKVRARNHTYGTKYILPNKSLWKGMGLCARCGGEGLHDGSYLCEDCYAQSLRSLEKARAVSLGNRAKKRAEQEAIEAQKEKELKEIYKPRTIWARRNKNKQKGSEQSNG